jgi:hypothetical protein
MKHQRMIPSICTTYVYDGTNVSISDDSLYISKRSVWWVNYKHELSVSKFSVKIELQLYFIHAGLQNYVFA